MEKKNLTKGFWLTFLFVCFILIVLVTIGFITFSNREEEVIDQVENGGRVLLKYSNDFDGMKIVNVVPTTDSVSMKSLLEGDYFDFSVDVSLDNAASIEYEISAICNKKDSTISNDDIKIYLEQEKSGSYTKVFGPSKFEGLKEDTTYGSSKGSMVLAHVKKTRSTPDNYRLRMWLSDKSLLEKGSYSITIEVHGLAK